MGKKALVKDSSTLSFGGFLGECLFADVTILIWYRGLFRCLPGLTYLQSMLVLGGILCASMFLFALVFSYDRTVWAVFLACAIPFGAYTVLIYRNTLWLRIRVFLILCILLSAALCARILLQRSGAGSRKRLLLRRAYRCLWGTSSVMAAASACLCIPMLLQQVFTGGSLYASVKAETSLVDEDVMIAENMDSILLLQEEEWAKLSSGEKLSVLQTIANIERNYFGLPNEVTVVSGALEKDLLGHYNDNTHTVCISVDSLEHDDARECLDTITHECYHSYQARQVDALRGADKELKGLRLFQAARAYGQEYACYKDVDSDPEGYWNQDLEKHARAYAIVAVTFYYELIEKYLEEESS